MRTPVWKREPWRTRQWVQLLVWFAFTWVVQASVGHGLWFYAALIVWVGMLGALPRFLPSRPFFGHPASSNPPSA